MCLRVSAIEYDGGAIKRVEFHAPVPTEAVPVVQPESDASFRARIRMAASENSVHKKRIDLDCGTALDEVGGFYGLIRRQG